MRYTRLGIVSLFAVVLSSLIVIMGLSVSTNAASVSNPAGFTRGSSPCYPTRNPTHRPSGSNQAHYGGLSYTSNLAKSCVTTGILSDMWSKDHLPSYARWTSYNGTWLSIAGQPTANTATVAAGSDIYLQLNTFSYRFFWAGGGSDTELQSVQIKHLSLTPNWVGPWGANPISVINTDLHWDMEMPGYKATNQQSTTWPNNLKSAQSVAAVSETKSSGFVFPQPLEINYKIKAPTTPGTYTITADMSDNGVQLKSSGQYLCMMAYDNESYYYPGQGYVLGARPNVGSLYNFNSGRNMKGWNNSDPSKVYPDTLCPTGHSSATITFTLNVKGNPQLSGFTSSPASSIVIGQSASWQHTLSNGGDADATGVVATIHQSKKASNGRMLVADSTTGTLTIPGGTLGINKSAVGNDSYTAQPGDIGDTICEWLVWTSTDGGNGQTNPTCTIVAKMPKLQIWGGDLRTGGDVDVSQTKISSPSPACFYGSWVEYGALIDGTNASARFGTGASLAGTPSACTHALGGAGTNPMTFANADSGGVLTGTSGFGNYGDLSLKQLGPIYNMMKTNQLNIPAAGSVSGNVGLAGLDGYYTANGNITITGGSIAAGKTIVIDDPGHTVTISGNITYAGNASSITALPQVVIVAGTINVNDSVTNIDAWLLADTLVDTCGNKSAGQVSLTTCSSPLRVNGPLVSKNANFKRTAGSDQANPGDPAETIDLRADAYLWEYAQASQHVTPTIVQVTQLPPRY